MKKQYIIPGLILITTALWLTGIPSIPQPGFWPLRRELILYSGVLAYMLMTASMLLSLRIGWLEQRLGGLDRVYQLHKWTGIGCGILLFSHWMLEILPKNLARAGWITGPVRRAAHSVPVGFNLKPLATGIGEWVTYAMLALIIIALLRRFPYHWFRKLHKVFPIAFLLITFHAAVLIPIDRWLSGGGALIVICAVIGCSAAVISLSGRIGASRRISGQTERVEHLPNGMLQVDCRVNGRGMPHQAGQFAFIRFPDAKDPHPFSIASSGDDPQQLRFCIKPLGDDTIKLAQTLQTGTPVVIEGPYGCFNFHDPAAEQIWVAGGVGIAPFLGQLEYLATQPAQRAQNIRLFYCARRNDPTLGKLRELCQRAGVELQVIDRRQGDALQLEALHPQAQRTALWYCGPLPLGNQLGKIWKKLGMPAQQFYREHFSMR